MRTVRPFFFLNHSGVECNLQTIIYILLHVNYTVTFFYMFIVRLQPKGKIFMIFDTQILENNLMTGAGCLAWEKGGQLMRQDIHRYYNVVQYMYLYLLLIYYSFFFNFVYIHIFAYTHT